MQKLNLSNVPYFLIEPFLSKIVKLHHIICNIIFFKFKNNYEVAAWGLFLELNKYDSNEISNHESV